nr:hypothetical protein [Tanacetum cinerariifolium]
MDSQSTSVVSAAKLPILNPNEFDLWKIRIEQYFLMTDYSLWEVIINGYSPVPTVIVEGAVQPTAILTVEQKLARRNELKLEKLVSQLESHRVSLSQEDVNLKFLRSLPSEWKTHTLIWRNKANQDKHISTATSVSAVCAQFHVSSHLNIDSLSNAVIFSFFASQSTSPQIDNEDLKQIDIDDLKEMDLRWRMAMLTMRARSFLQKTGRNLGDNKATTMGFDMSKVECYNCHRKGHFARECRSYDWSYQADEEPANFALMAIPSSSSTSDNESDCETLSPSSLSYRSQPSGEYHVVPPPITGNFMPSKPDLVFHTAPIAVETTHSAFTVQPSSAKLAQDISHATRPMAPIIEDWVSDSEDESEPNDTQIPAAVITKSKPVSVTAVRPVSAAVPKIMATKPRHASSFHKKTNSNIRRHKTRSRFSKTSNSFLKVTAAQAKIVSAVKGKRGKIGTGPTWLFDIDSLTRTMNYQTVTARNQSNPSVSFQEEFDAGKTREEAIQQYMLFHVWFTGSTNPHNKEGDATFDGNEHSTEHPESTVNLSLGSSALSGEQDDITKKRHKGKSHVDYFIGNKDFNEDFEDYSKDSSNDVSTAGHIVPTAGQNYFNSTNPISVVGPSNSNTSPIYGNSSFQDASQSHDMPENEDIVHSNHKNIGADADFNNLTSITVSPIPTIRIHNTHPISQIIGNLSSTTQTRSMARINRDQGRISQILNEDFHTCMFACFLSQEEPKRVHQALKYPSWIEAMQEELLQFKMHKVWILVDLPHGKRSIGHTQEEGIVYEEVFAPVARIEAIRLFLAYASIMGFMVYQMDVKSAFLYRTIEEEVYVCQPSGFEDPGHPDKVYKVVKALYGLHQAPRAWYETLATYLQENGFHRGQIDQTLFIKKQKGDILLVYIYVDNIIFGATNKDLCKSFEKLMKDKFQMSSMGELTFFLGKSASTPIYTEKPLLKDLNVIAISSTEAEYVAGASCCAQVLWIQNQMLDYSKSDASEGFDQIIEFINRSCITYALTVNPTIYVSCIKQFWRTVAVKSSNDVTRLQALIDKKRVVVTEAAIRDALHLDDAEGVDCLPNEEIFIELTRMGYEKPTTKLTFYKAFFTSQWKFLIHIILQSMSAKRTSWNEFSSAMASAVICLSTGRKFNFSMYIFESLVRNVDSSTKFYMYPRFINLIIQNQLGDLSTHSTKYISSALTQKVFVNMRRVGKGCSGVETPLFEGMLVAREPEEQGDVEEQGNKEEQGNADTTAEEPETAIPEDVANDQPIPLPALLTPPPQQPQDEALDAYAALARRVEHLEQDKLRRLRKVGTSQRVDTSADTLLEDVSNQGRVIDIDEDAVKETEKVREYTANTQVEGRQADIYHIDMDHAAKVLISAVVVIPSVVPETISIAAAIPTVTAPPVKVDAPVKAAVPSTR